MAEPYQPGNYLPQLWEDVKDEFVPGYGNQARLDAALEADPYANMEGKVSSENNARDIKRLMQMFMLATPTGKQVGTPGAISGVFASPKRVFGQGEANRLAHTRNEMLQGGVPEQKIWEQLKIARGPGGDLRTEIQGADPARIQELVRFLSSKEENPRQLGGIIQAGQMMTPEFKKAYPELGGLELLARPMTGKHGTVAGFQPHTEIPSSAGPAGPARFKFTPGYVQMEHVPSMEHEFTHGVQATHGWPRGAGMNEMEPLAEAGKLPGVELSNDEISRLVRLMFRMHPGADPSKAKNILDPRFLSYLKSAGETEARNAQRRVMFPELQKIHPQYTEDLPRSAQWIQRFDPRNPDRAPDFSKRAQYDAPLIPEYPLLPIEELAASKLSNPVPGTSVKWEPYQDVIKAMPKEMMEVLSRPNQQDRVTRLISQMRGQPPHVRPMSAGAHLASDWNPTQKGLHDAEILKAFEEYMKKQRGK